MTRKEILQEAEKCVCTDRNNQYGEPEDSFSMIAALWNSYLDIDETFFSIKPCDVAVMMALLKIARIASAPDKMNSWIDLAGYAACGAECAEHEVEYRKFINGEENKNG